MSRFLRCPWNAPQWSISHYPTLTFQFNRQDGQNAPTFLRVLSSVSWCCQDLGGAAKWRRAACHVFPCTRLLLTKRAYCLRCTLKHASDVLWFLLAVRRGLAWRSWYERCLLCWLCLPRWWVCLKLKKDEQWCCCVLKAVSHIVCWATPKHSCTVTPYPHTQPRRDRYGAAKFPSLVFPATTRSNTVLSWSEVGWVLPLI